MTTEFKLYGLNKLKNEHYMSATLLLDNEDSFHARIDGDKAVKDAMWAYCKNHWKDKKIAVVQHDGFGLGGIPINPWLLYIKEI